jgi:hypothetical protein
LGGAIGIWMLKGAELHVENRAIAGPSRTS